MELSITDQANQLAKNIQLLMMSTQHLDESYRSKLEKMCVKMNEFVISYHTHAVLSSHEYTSFLNHDALSPLTIVLGYAELFRSINSHVLTMQEFNLITVICEQSRTLTDSLRKERDILVAQRDKSISL